MVMAPPPAHDSAVSPCFHGFLAFLNSISRHNLLPQFISPLSVSPQSMAALPLGLLHNPYTPAPSCYTFQGTCIPVQGRYGCSKDCLILIPFRLSQISCLTLSLKCFFSDPDNCPNVGIGPLLQFPPSTEVRFSPTNIAIRVFSKESALPIRWSKYQSFSFSISLSIEYSGLIYFRIDWLDPLAV